MRGCGLRWRHSCKAFIMKDISSTSEPLQPAGHMTDGGRPAINKQKQTSHVYLMIIVFESFKLQIVKT